MPAYVPCPECLCPKPEHRGPGTPVPMPGTAHYRECPTLPRLSPADRAELVEALQAIADAERRAWEASAHIYLR
jgi:hypothetical protein